MSEERQDPAASRSWTNITFGPKDFIAAFLFVITLSGTYYNGVYKSESAKKELEADLNAAKARIKDLEDKEKEQDAELRVLQDDKLQREAIERDRAHSGYGPMQRVK